MMLLGQLSLLIALLASGCAAVTSIAGARTHRPSLRHLSIYSALASAVSLTIVILVLSWALLRKDFSFAYVASYSSTLLPWHYSLSALWVGQAGSLLLWAWMLSLLSLLLLIHGRAVFRRLGDNEASRRRQVVAVVHYAFGLVIAYLFFLTATMVFAADPLESRIHLGGSGSGLSPLLQHPAMLIHPPIVFLAYAGWTVPCALLFANLLVRGDQRDWFHMVRPWTLASWTLLGTGILLGGQWSYEELGWGGFWAWDPVENGSLLPWLTGTAFLHALMAWRLRGILKKSASFLAVATFGLCNFATFLTRSGIFSSLHAFSQSPIGWLFLALMAALGLIGITLIYSRGSLLAPDRPIESIVARESLIALSTAAWLLLALAVLVGTLSLALSELLIGRRIILGPEFYNNALIATALPILAAMAPVPLLSWGRSPAPKQRNALLIAVVVSTLGAVVAYQRLSRDLLTLLVLGLVLFALASLVASILIEAHTEGTGRFWTRLFASVRSGRRHHAGHVIHMGFGLLALGITGASLGAQRHEIDLSEGRQIEWSGRRIRFTRLALSEQPERRIVEAHLQISSSLGPQYQLRPAQHLHKLQNLWTTEAAIHADWTSDFYAILQYGENSTAHFTFLVNPMMRWIRLGGWLMGLGTLVALWPSSSRRKAPVASPPGDRLIALNATSRHLHRQPHSRKSGTSRR